MSDTWLIADTHFAHKNIIKYENRPFTDAREMDEAMIKNWNSVVKADDVVYHLGDVAFGKYHKENTVRELISRLNGTKILILGNHDFADKRRFAEDEIGYYKDFYRSVGFRDVYSDADNFILEGMLLTHYPKQSQIGIKNVHGHVHSNIEGLDQRYLKCISVELINYTPIHIDALLAWANEDDGYED